MEMDIDKIIEDSMTRLAKVKIKMDQPERWTEEDARYVFEDVSHEMRARKISEEKDRRTEKIIEEKKLFSRQKTDYAKPVENGKTEIKTFETKKKMVTGTKYKFNQKPGHATNPQLELIQNMRSEAGEEPLQIDLDVEQVPRMTFNDADKEIKRLKQKMKWKDQK